jgi:RNA polymerase sigma factor (sigma-70 family)
MNSAYFRKLGGHALLTAQEELELGRRIQAGGADAARAKERLFTHNTRLVLSEAKKYVHRGVEFEDLVQSGMIGLNRACELFDPERGFKFSTYATIWINQALGRAVEKSELIHLPSTVKRIRFYAARNPDETPGEIAAACKVTLRRVRWALEAPVAVGSVARDGDDAVEWWADPLADDPLDLIDEGLGDETRWLRERLDRLPADQRDVIEMQFGINGYEREHEFPEIAHALQRTASAVRKLSEAALASLLEGAGHRALDDDA